MALLHKIRAALYLNLLTEDPNDYSAKVISERTLDVKKICAEAVTRGGAQTTAETMENNVNLFFKEMGYQLCNGYYVNTGYFTAGAHVRGVFNKKDEQFDPEKHSILFQFNQGEMLRKEIPSVEVQITGVADSSTSISQVIDVKSGSIDDLITPNRNLKIGGYKIKLAGDHTDVGVYFVNTTTADRTKVDPSEIAINNPSELMIIIPELVAGAYQLEVCTQYAGSALLKEPRTCTYEKILTVE